MMAKEKKKVPNLRFKGFTDDWEQRKLKDVVEKQIKGKAQFEKLAPGEVEYLDTSRLNGGQAILTNGLKDVTLDDILILWDGSKAGTVYHGFEGALGSTLKAYRTSANSKFVYQYLKRHQDNIYNNYRTPNIPHVQKDFLNVFTISVPVSDEQEKIGSFFQQLDNTIVLHQRKLDLLKQLKKGFLQKMFADKDSKQPVLRFKGFHDDWEQRKLSKLITEIGTGKSKYKAQDNGRYPILGSTSVIGYDNNFDYTGDFILTARVGANAGKLYQFSGSVKITDNTVFIKSKHNKFLYYYLQKYDLKKLSFGTGQPLVKASELKNLKILKPRLDEEIYRISKLLLSVDNLITLQQQKLIKYQSIKKSLLQQMFM